MPPSSLRRQDLLGAFLVEAWDALASIEEELGRAPRAATGGPWEAAVTLAERLAGSAALNGFPGVSSLASALEATVERAARAQGEARGAALAGIGALVAALKRALDDISVSGVENGEDIAAALAGAGEPARADLRELVRFFRDSTDVLAYFGPEAAGHLDTMTASAMALDRQPSEAEVAALLRAVHTLKGAAYTVGCRPMGDLAHRMEDLVVAVRQSPQRLTPAILEAVLAGTDALRAMLDSQGQVTTELADTVARAWRLLDTVTVPPAEAVSATPPPPAAAPVETVAPTPAERPRAADAASAAPAALQPTLRPGIRIDPERVDALMNLVNELVVARSRLDGRLTQFERATELLRVLQERAARAGRPGPLAGSEPDRGDDATVMGRRVSEIAADVAEIHRMLAAHLRAAREDTAHVQRLTGDLRAELTRARMVPIGRLFARFERQVREAARLAGKRVRLEVSGEGVELDTGIVEQLADPLLHLVQNAVVHGIEAEDERRAHGKPGEGTIRLSAAQRGGAIHVEVADDGRGIDTEHLRALALERGLLDREKAALLGARALLDLIFQPGFTTAVAVTATAGRGVGLDVVRTNITRLGGDVEVETDVGAGTRFTLVLPPTVAISEALLLRAGGEIFALPMTAVRQVLRLHADDVHREAGTATVMVEDHLVDLVHLHEILGLPAGRPALAWPVVVIRSGRRTVAARVDEVLGKEEIVIKGLGAFLEGVGPYAGATISGQGRVILLLDPARLVEATASVPETAPPRRAPARRVLLVDDSISVRRSVGQMLERAGFEVLAAADGVEALARLAGGVNLVVTDLEMPRLNGYELIRDLRQRPAGRDLPVIVLTTRASERDRDLARQLGVAHFIAKPVEEKAFLGLVESMVPTPAGARPEVA